MEYNHKLSCYVAPNLDPRASATDALSLEWNQWDRISPFFPGQPSLESPPQAENIQREGSAGSPRLAEEQLVSPPPGTPPPPHLHSPPGAVPDSANQDRIGFILAYRHNNFMEFLKFAAKR